MPSLWRRKIIQRVSQEFILADGLNFYCKSCVSEMNSRKKAVHKLYTNPKLADFHPRELIAELKARGYTGELQFTQKIIV